MWLPPNARAIWIIGHAPFSHCIPWVQGWQKVDWNWNSHSFLLNSIVNGPKTHPTQNIGFLGNCIFDMSRGEGIFHNIHYPSGWLNGGLFLICTYHLFTKEKRARTNLQRSQISLSIVEEEIWSVWREIWREKEIYSEWEEGKDFFAVEWRIEAFFPLSKRHQTEAELLSLPLESRWMCGKEEKTKRARLNWLLHSSSSHISSSSAVVQKWQQEARSTPPPQTLFAAAALRDRRTVSTPNVRPPRLGAI